MPTSAFLLALGAAFVHALWNLLLAWASDPEAATAVALLVAVVVFAPVLAFTWELEAAAWPYIAASSVLELVYFALLGAAYRRAEVSVVYPLARGVAPLLVLAVGALALGAETTVVQALGVCLVGLGVVLVRGLRRPARAAGVLFGLAIACSIAAYTLVDDEGIRYANAVTYLELVLVVPAIGYALGIGLLKGREALRQELSAATVAAGPRYVGRLRPRPGGPRAGRGRSRWRRCARRASSSPPSERPSSCTSASAPPGSPGRRSWRSASPWSRSRVRFPRPESPDFRALRAAAAARRR